LAEVDLDFSQTANGMEAARFCRHKLHIFEEDWDHREPGFLGDVVKARLARTHANAVAARPFGKHHEVKVAGSPAKILKFANATGIKLSAFEKKADAAAEDSFDPGAVPDRFVAQNEDGVTSGTPAKPAQ
jgi:hypothetical protein